MSRRHPRLRILGLTDRTGLVGRDGQFTVYGRGTVTLVQELRAPTFGPGSSLVLPTTSYVLHDRPQAAAGSDRAVAPGLLRLVQRGVGSLD